MSTTDNYFSLLSKVMAEQNISESEESLNIDKIFNSIYSAIDEKLMTTVETADYEAKYDIIDNLKNMLIQYRILLYFPELVGKTVVSFYNYTEKPILILALDYLGLNCSQERLAKKLWFPSEIPCIFTNREYEDFVALNIPENTVALNYTDYMGIKKLTSKMFDTEGLIVMLSAPLKNEMPGVAFCTIPENKDNLYVNTVSDLTDVLFVSARDIKLFNDKRKVDIFKNLKMVVVYGKLDRGYANSPEAFPDTVRRVFVDSFKEALDYLKSTPELINTVSNNTTLAPLMEYQINRIISHLTRQISAERSKLKSINEGIFISSDQKTAETARLLRDSVTNKISDNEHTVKAIVEVKDEICQNAVELEKTVSEIIDTDCCETVDHYPLKDVYCKLFLQYCSFAKSEYSYVEQRDYYKGLLAKYCSEYEMASDIIARDGNVRTVEYDGIMDIDTDDEFIIGAQVLFGSHYSKEKKEALARRASKLKNCNSEIEYYYRGVSSLNENKPEQAISDLKYALEMGFEKAGNELFKLCKDDDEMLKYLAEMMVPDACYQIGKDDVREAIDDLSDVMDTGSTTDGAAVLRMIQTDDFSKSLFYVKVAAAKKNKSALLNLEDYYNYLYQNYHDKYILMTDDEIEKTFNMAVAYSKELINRKINISYNYFLLGHHYYYHEDYYDARTCFEKSDEVEAKYFIGLMIEDGKGCSVDIEEAQKYYFAAKNGGSSRGAAGYDRVTAKIAEEKRRKAQAEAASYSSYTYYSSSYYSSYYSGYSSYSSGCVVAGTKILTADGSLINVEDIVEQTAIRNCRGLISYTSDELVVNTDVKILYSINDDEPFMSLEHTILTQRGWCSLAPEMSMAINRFFEVKMLEIGDVIKKAVIKEGKVEYIDCVVEKINTRDNIENLVCYDLHFYDGYNSYYANGYPCLLNYPTFTLARMTSNAEQLTVEQRERLKLMSEEYHDILSELFGDTTMDIFFMNGSKYWG